MKYILLFIIFFIILIIIIYYLKKKNIESFVNSKRYILKDCEANWANIYNRDPNDCIKNAWVANPELLCGICDPITGNQLYSFQSENGNMLYGCSPSSPNLYGLSWNATYSNNQMNTLNNYLSNILSCNTYNENATSDLYMYVCSNNPTSINVNGQVANVSPANNWELMIGSLFTSIPFNANVSISTTNTCGQAGFCVCYFWNGQLYILDNNGYETSINVIKYIVNGSAGFSNSTSTEIWYGNWIGLPWMSNWMILPDCESCSGCSNTLTITFNVGDTQNLNQLKNDLTIVYSLPNSSGGLSVNGSSTNGSSDIASTGATVINGTFIYVNTIQEVATGATLELSGQCSIPQGNSTFNTCPLMMFYVYCGLFYTISSSIQGFNNCVNLIQYTPSNIIGTQDMTEYQTNPPFLPLWLMSCSEENCTFNITTILSTPLDTVSLPSVPNSPIICGANNFCVNNENNNTNYYCYGNTQGCLWGSWDCQTDSDCNKYNDSSPRYTDNQSNGQPNTCQNETSNYNGWPYNACGYVSTPPAIKPTPPPPPPISNSPVVCGKFNFCVNNENNNTNYYCYGNTQGCLWGSNDCQSDSDCNKYNDSSPRYTDMQSDGQPNTCANETSIQNGWPYNACGYG